MTAVKVKTYLRCPWACGRKVHRKRGRALCWECQAFLKRYTSARVHKTQCGVGDERYAALKAERVAMYADRVAAGLPLWGAVA